MWDQSIGEKQTNPPRSRWIVVPISYPKLNMFFSSLENKFLKRVPNIPKNDCKSTKLIYEPIKSCQVSFSSSGKQVCSEEKKDQLVTKEIYSCFLYIPLKPCFRVSFCALWNMEILPNTESIWGDNGLHC